MSSSPEEARHRRASRGVDLLRRLYYGCAALVVDPVRVGRSWRALPHYVKNGLSYSRRVGAASFQISPFDLQFATFDRFGAAGSIRGHYFLQDLWAARHLFQRNVEHHTDVGSRVDGFIAHVLTFARVTYLDLRPIGIALDGLTYQRASITDLPLEDGTVGSLSCLHVIEHIGLGRYGDRVDPQGHVRAAAELSRVLKPGAQLLIATPVGRERLCFDAHRIFDPESVASLFQPLVLREFHVIDDRGVEVQENASFEHARLCTYGCGLFVFERAASSP